MTLTLKVKFIGGHKQVIERVESIRSISKHGFTVFSLTEHGESVHTVLKDVEKLKIKGRCGCDEDWLSRRAHSSVKVLS